MILLLACTTPPAATVVSAAEEAPPAKRYTRADIAAVTERFEATAQGTPVRAFAREEGDGDWQRIPTLHDLPDGITAPGAEYAVEAAEYFALFTLDSGERLVQTGTIAQGDGHDERSYLFSPRGRLLRFSRTEGGVSGCGEIFWTVTVDYPIGEEARRSFTHTLSGPSDDPHYRETCAAEIRADAEATDPGWGPRWLLQDELPVDTITAD